MSTAGGRPDGHLDGRFDSLLDPLLDQLFAHGTKPPAGSGITLATVVIHRGRIVAERYGTRPDTVFGPGGPVDENTTLVSWSMAKSITHALVGLLVDEGRMHPDQPVDIPEWRGDIRSTITLRDLLRMRDGLDFVEEYVIPENTIPENTIPDNVIPDNVIPVSDVIEMLFGSGADDVAAYARSRPARSTPGETFSYSSGATNIVCSLIADIVGRGDAFKDFIVSRLFEPLGMSSAVPRTDPAGTFIGSSFVYATARDFARFGGLYLNGGEWEGRRILSREWVENSFDMHALDPDNGHGYSHHWWLWNGRRRTIAALGYEGQRTIVDPDRDLVLVHLGIWPADTQRRLDQILDGILDTTAEVIC